MILSFKNKLFIRDPFSPLRYVVIFKYFKYKIGNIITKVENKIGKIFKI